MEASSYRHGQSLTQSPVPLLENCCSDTKSCLTLCDPMDCSTPGLSVHHQLPEFAHSQVHHFSDAIQSSHPLSSPSPPAFNLSQHQGLFKWVSSSHQISLNISPSNEYSGVLSFRMGWLDLFAVQGTLKSLLQHHSSKVSILWCSAFFIVQLSRPYLTTGKTIALTFVGKVMSLLFNTLSRFVIAFLPRSKCLLNFMAAVTIRSDFEAQEQRVYHCFHFPPFFRYEKASCQINVDSRSSSTNFPNYAKFIHLSVYQ